MFKKRNNILDSEDLQNVESSESKKHTLATCKTYLDEVFLTLEVLEKEQNINIYGGTLPGMWLNKKNQNKVSQIFEKLNEKNVEVDEEVNKEIIPNNLINFFKNGKKE